MKSIFKKGSFLSVVAILGLLSITDCIAYGQEAPKTAAAPGSTSQEVRYEEKGSLPRNAQKPAAETQSAKGSQQKSEVKKVQSSSPSIAKRPGARPPSISRPSGTGMPKGAGKPAGIGKPGRR
ncbi:MAG TPA: hypothetical protein VK213_07365 [Bacteroidales bacterium]|nr:hypothetical protein [Bacteroidales bacterium]